MQTQDVHDKTVVVAPLDWGMGHVTRCVPLIRQFLKQNCQVIFAGTTSQISFIKKDFPAIICEVIEGYNVSLDASKSTYFQMLQQGVHLNRIIHKEQEVAQQIQRKYEADVVLSDNRYGFRSDKAYNIILTHQLSPPVPHFRKQLTKQLAKYINQFDCCWIPDSIDQPIVSDLNEVELKIPKVSIGWLSRFVLEQQPLRYDFLFVSSGPLPERHKFERQMYDLLRYRNSVFVTPDNEVIKSAVVNPSTAELNSLINKSKWVVSRNGYTTIMEMICLRKQAWLIPTPKQYEQEWLGQHLELDFIFNGKIEQFKDFLCLEKE